MPVLARETDLYPDNLLEPPAAPGSDFGVWQVAHTLPRREKELARRLRRSEVPFYLPLIEQRTRTPAGRKMVSHLPLFPGYVFVHADTDQTIRVLETNCVARLLTVPDSTELLFDLAQIHRLTQSGQPLHREPEFQPGTPVRVVAGPFQGFEGQVLKHQSGDRLLVLVNYLQQGISVSLEGCDVERK